MIIVIISPEEREEKVNLYVYRREEIDSLFIKKVIDVLFDLEREIVVINKEDFSKKDENVKDGNIGKDI